MFYCLLSNFEYAKLSWMKSKVNIRDSLLETSSSFVTAFLYCDGGYAKYKSISLFHSHLDADGVKESWKYDKNYFTQEICR